MLCGGSARPLGAPSQRLPSQGMLRKLFLRKPAGEADTRRPRSARDSFISPHTGSHLPAKTDCDF
eukprot:1190209-Prymnesium_polylepis.1